MLRIRAGTVHPITAPPIQDGAVLVDDDGRIAAVGPHLHIPHPAPHDLRSYEFPNAILTPGFVNCHTHLELTHLAGRNPERDFVAWIRRVRELKDATPPDEFVQSAERGVRECWRHGVTTVADTGSTGAAMRVLAAAGGRGIAYQEVFGPDPDRLHASLQELETALDVLAPCAGPRLRLGVSPHAPYTVSEQLYRAVAALAGTRGLPVAVHLAESEAETLLVRDGTGPFADALRSRGIPVRGRGFSPVRYLDGMGLLAAETLCIHCVQLDHEDVSRLARSGAAVAHCPRSNAAHGHGRAPLAAMRTAGIRVGLGTDSLVSVHDGSLWSEAEAAGLDGEDALRVLTIEGARTLRLDQEIGSLEVGKAADLAVFPSSALDRPRPPSFLTVLAGRIVHDVHS